MSGVLFSFEGVDGVGKTTQVGLLKASLEERGHTVLCLREPGGTVLGEKIRGLLLDRSEDPPLPVAELLLFAAARAQIVATRVRPALERGEVVLLDRFTDATFAYQGYGRNLSHDQILSLEAIAAGIEPHRTWILDLAPEESARRRAARGESPDRMESEGEAFRGRVREGYLERARRHGGRIRVIDASDTIEAIAERILAEAVECLTHR